MVPGSVPSLRYTPPAAIKMTLPSKLVRFPGPLFNGPGLISLTNRVPSSVPSLFHSSIPVEFSLPTKQRVPLTFVRLYGRDVKNDVGANAFTISVPDGVPSVFHKFAVSP